MTMKEFINISVKFIYYSVFICNPNFRCSNTKNSDFFLEKDGFYNYLLIFKIIFTKLLIK